MSTETATEAHGNPTAAGGPAWTAGGVADGIRSLTNQDGGPEDRSDH